MGITDPQLLGFHVYIWRPSSSSARWSQVRRCSRNEGKDSVVYFKGYERQLSSSRSKAERKFWKPCSESHSCSTVSLIWESCLGETSVASAPTLFTRSHSRRKQTSSGKVESPMLNRPRSTTHSYYCKGGVEIECWAFGS